MGKEMAIEWTDKTDGKTMKDRGRKKISMRRGYRRGKNALFCMSWVIR
jgi:hypothetical protein